MEQKIVIAGGSGFLGELTAHHFTCLGWKVVVLSRKPKKGSGLFKHRQWDGRTPDNRLRNELEGAQVLLNLCGRSVDCRYTRRNKHEILTSRLQSTRCLAAAVADCSKPPQLWINASSATIYKHAFDPQDEYRGETGEGFSVDVCQQWEQAFFERPVPGVRKVALRLGIVLGREAGALLPLQQLVKWRLGARFGPGNQYISWLHQQDYLHILQFLIETPAAHGPINATAPQPLANRQFLKIMRKSLGITWSLPLPAALLQAGALLIGTETELILKSRCVVPGRLQEMGYHFRYPDLPEALKDLLGNTGASYTAKQAATLPTGAFKFTHHES